MNIHTNPNKNVLILSLITLLIFIGMMVRFSGVISDHNQAGEPLETFVPR